jgi:hypothetical protein
MSLAPTIVRARAFQATQFLSTLGKDLWITGVTPLAAGIYRLSTKRR